MKSNRRTIEIVGKVVKKSDADTIDAASWLAKSIEERLIETERLRRLVWTFRLGAYPEKIEITGQCISKAAYISGNDI